jgi:2-C-methyl-D-erythritol 2,4-cyclodiphosphate synthase
MRVGIGVDAHRLVTGRPLVLGGVEIAHERGLLGHSDADVLAHAICDALLGAAGLGDLGAHFPDDDPQFAGVSGLWLLARSAALVADAGCRVDQVDVTVVAERPKLAPHVPRMREQIARALGVPPDRVGVKATTFEGMGFLGREEGIAAWAVAALCEPGDESPPEQAGRFRPPG